MKNIKLRISGALTTAIPRQFWRVSFLIVLGHTLLMSPLIAMGLAGLASNYKSIFQKIMSPYDAAHFFMLLIQLVAIPLITVQSLIAIIAFAMKRRGRHIHTLLKAYIFL